MAEYVDKSLTGWVSTKFCNIKLDRCKEIIYRSDLKKQEWEMLKLGLMKTNVCIDYSKGYRSRAILFLTDKLVIII